MKRTLWLLLVLILASGLSDAQRSKRGRTNAEEYGSRSNTFTVAKGGNLEVELGVGEIRIRTWEKAEVSVNATDIDEDNIDGIRMVQRGNTIRVEYDPEWGWSDDALFEISIPSTFNIDVQTSAGDIAVTGTINGTINGETSGGDITLDNVTGTVTMETAGGDIAVGDIDGDLSLSTSGGDIKTGEVSGVAHIETAGGDIEVQRVGKTLRAETSGGNVEVGATGGDLIVSTSGGNIMIDRVSGSAELTTAGGNISLAGASGTVKAKTAGGDIRLDSISGSVLAKTTAGNIDVFLNPKGAASSRLTTSVGDIRLYLPAGAKANVSARLRLPGKKKYFRDDYEISSDFPETKGGSDAREESDREIHSSYVVNGGGAEITLEASHGSIELRKAESLPFGSKSKRKHKNKD